MGMNIQISCNTADGATLKAFAKVLEQRVRYMHQTARQAVIASAITVLKSVRAATKVVKPNKVKINLFHDETLFASCKDGRRRVPCIRIVGTRQQYHGREIVKIADDTDFHDAKVYRWRFDTFKGPRWYLIVASFPQSAEAVARRIVNGRIEVYKGLAKRALSVLMMKTSNVNVNDKDVSGKARSTALKQTQTREVVASNKNATEGKYLLYLLDNLNYSVAAVKGGQSAVDTAMKKALNGITAQISKKIKTVDFFGRKMTLPSPFPEVKGKK